jgi:outer membrane protein OmpA-like peptidoglycan-associated protein
MLSLPNIDGKSMHETTAIKRCVTFAKLLLPILLLALLSCANQVAGQQQTPNSMVRPRVCSNLELIKAIRIIDRACNKLTCDFATLRELDKRVNKSALLQAFRTSDIQSVHIFFPQNEVELKRSFDWATVKKDQLDTIKFIDNPSNAVVFVLGRASTTGDFELNKRLSRERLRSVMSYLETELHVRCHSFHGGWLGKEIQQWSMSDADFLKINHRDFRNDDLILNQSVHVFVFPCADLLD